MDRRQASGKNGTIVESGRADCGLWREKGCCSPLLPGLLLLLQQLCGIESVVLEQLPLAVGQSGVNFMGPIAIRRVCFVCRQGVWLAVFSVVVVLLMVYRIHLEAVGSIDRTHFEWNCVRHVACSLSLALCGSVWVQVLKKFWVSVSSTNANNFQNGQVRPVLDPCTLRPCCVNRLY